MDQSETETAIRLPGWAGPRPVLERGAVLGRYFILDRLGSGGMGVVYAAYDPELDRKVAVKLLWTGSEVRVRLLREAQAMARLSHPNVVTVHDVGTFGDQVFVAMELVDGADLREWLAAAPRSPRSRREILEVFVAAGQGLVAAHAAGLVHLDFKPANVLVGRDGRARVADFGLARESGGGEGGSAGTPGYMAPEQIENRPVDARTDQFSFCVSLYEALYGERPFDLDSWTVRNAPAGSRVPTRLRRLLLRGLAVNPEDRFASMADLLAALESGPHPARRRWALALMAVVAGSALLGLGWIWRERAQICGGAEGRLAGVWDPARKEAVRRAFLKTGAPFAGSAFQGVERALDAYAQSWVAMRTDACEATRRRGEQSEEVLDLRMGCFERRLEEVRALTDLFARADAQVVEGSVQAAGALPGLAGCGDVAALTAPVKPPAALRSRIEGVQKDLAAAKALLDTGKYAEGLAAARKLAATARALKHPPLEAEALDLLGRFQDRSGDPGTAEKTLHEALWAAEAGRDGWRSVEVGTELVRILGNPLERFEESRRWEGYTAAKIRGLGGNAEKEAWLLYSAGVALDAQGRFEESAGKLRAAIPILERTLGPHHLAVAKARGMLANALAGMGRFEEAARQMEECVRALEGSLGPNHPFVATSWNNLGSTLNILGRSPEALKALESALRIREKALGPGHPEVAATLTNIGYTLTGLGRPGEALPYHRRALAIFERTLGPRSSRLAYPLFGIGQAYIQLDRPGEAVAPLRRAAALGESTQGPLDRAKDRLLLADALWQSGAGRAEALALVRQVRRDLAGVENTGDVMSQIDTWLAEKSSPGGT